ncbi:penicillin-binding transpeptidase domain-containing protein [Streptomyces sp. TP-A0874]|uniref:penicillin-binding transpeptidase domain-containing protein n=1 Tax=Streptomyces sp. TP-A0874 TaxID=549819 RepID=UPI000853ADC4|nr:penicillin-binding transpeptidase domain-containing protein [Streptomyces sp. TP-A0874]
MRKGAKVAIVGGVLTAVAGAAGYGVFNLIGEGAGKTGEKTSGAETVKVRTGPPSAAEVKTTAADFLRSWAAGDLGEAAALTDDTAAAKAALTGYRDEAHIEKVALEAGTPKGRKVPFSVTADVVYEEQRTTWTYDSELTVERDKSTGAALVDWQPSVVHPGLEDGDTLKTGEAEAPPIKAVDRNGVELTPEEHPALAGILNSLRERYGDKTDGTAGVELWISRGEGKSGKKDGAADEKAAERPDETLKVLSKGVPGTLRTTLDARLQTVAEQAVNKRSKASVVALKASTGEILAVANSPAEGFNSALQGSLAPGSTMKVVTAAMLMEKGLASPAEQHPCPKYFTYGHWKFHNDDKFEISGGTFAQSFARSCNTAFISQAPELSDDDLTKEARDVFGLGLDWQTGVPTFDGSVPVQQQAQMGASLIGQGGVRMNPLNMASVAATATTGTFHQPVIVPQSVDNRRLAQAPRAMKPGISQQLRDLMRLTATSGTAAQAMAGLSGDIGAKTGSAEVDGQEKPNGWFTAYRDDLAVAGVVPQGGHGGETAGPIVAEILRAGG